MHAMMPLLTDAAIQADKLRLARLLNDALERSTDLGDRRRLTDQRKALGDNPRAGLRAA
jgi:hypothetical protein